MSLETVLSELPYMDPAELRKVRAAVTTLLKASAPTKGPARLTVEQLMFYSALIAKLRERHVLHNLPSDEGQVRLARAPGFDVAEFSLAFEQCSAFQKRWAPSIPNSGAKRLAFWNCIVAAAWEWVDRNARESHRLAVADHLWFELRSLNVGDLPEGQLPYCVEEFKTDYVKGGDGRSLPRLIAACQDPDRIMEEAFPGYGRAALALVVEGLYGRGHAK